MHTRLGSRHWGQPALGGPQDAQLANAKVGASLSLTPLVGLYVSVAPFPHAGGRLSVSLAQRTVWTHFSDSCC